MSDAKQEVDPAPDAKEEAGENEQLQVVDQPKAAAEEAAPEPNQAKLQEKPAEPVVEEDPLTRATLEAYRLLRDTENTRRAALRTTAREHAYWAAFRAHLVGAELTNQVMLDFYATQASAAKDYAKRIAASSLPLLPETEQLQLCGVQNLQGLFPQQPQQTKARRKSATTASAAATSAAGATGKEGRTSRSSSSGEGRTVAAAAAAAAAASDAASVGVVGASHRRRSCPDDPAAGAAAAALASAAARAAVNGESVPAPTVVAYDPYSLVEQLEAAHADLARAQISAARQLFLFAKAVERDVVGEELEPSLAQFKVASDRMIGEGDTATGRVERAQAEVFHAYARCTGAAPREGIVEDEDDPWLLSFRYYAAVSSVDQAMEARSTLMSKMFLEFQLADHARTTSLAQAERTFIQYQQQAFGGLDLLLHAPSSTLGRLNATPEVLRDSLKDMLKKRATAIQQAMPPTPPSLQELPGSPRASEGADVPNADVPNADVPNAAVPNAAVPAVAVAVAAAEIPPELPIREGHPLRDGGPLVLKAAWLHRQTTVVRNWRRAFCVLTRNGYLHIANGTATPTPEQVTDPYGFIAHILRTSEPEKQAKVDAAFVSLTIAGGAVQYMPKVHANAFQLTETKPNTGFVSVFKASSSRKVVLKVESQEEMVEWVCAIKTCFPHE